MSHISKPNISDDEIAPDEIPVLHTSHPRWQAEAVDWLSCLEDIVVIDDAGTGRAILCRGSRFARPGRTWDLLRRYLSRNGVIATWAAADER